MNTRRETFSKSEKLCSTKLICGLFEKGNTLHTALFKVVWDESPVRLPFPAQAAFSASKKGFPHAVERNLIKRRMREAWRKNKYLLYECLSAENRQMVLIIIVKGNVVPGNTEIEESMKNLIGRLIRLAAGGSHRSS